MNIQDAVYQFAKSEIIPLLAGENEFLAGLINGALRAGRKKINIKSPMLQNIGLVDDNGEINSDNAKEFFDGVFDEREKLRVSLAELLKMSTGIDSDNILLQDKITFTRSDAERFLELLNK